MFFDIEMMLYRVDVMWLGVPISFLESTVIILIIQTKLNNFNSGVQILTIINDFSRKGGGVQIISRFLLNLETY